MCKCNLALCDVHERNLSTHFFYKCFLLLFNTNLELFYIIPLSFALTCRRIFHLTVITSTPLHLARKKSV